MTLYNDNEQFAYQTTTHLFNLTDRYKSHNFLLTKHLSYFKKRGVIVAVSEDSHNTAHTFYVNALFFKGHSNFALRD